MPRDTAQQQAGADAGDDLHVRLGLEDVLRNGALHDVHDVVIEHPVEHAHAADGDGAHQPEQYDDCYCEHASRGV